MGHLELYPIANFSFGSKEAQPTEETAVQDRINSVRNYYEAHGMRRVVDAVMLVHVDRHPHVLLIQIGQRFFRLPGGYLKPGEDEREGLGNRLNELLGHPAGPDGKAAENFDWNVGECISTWWRPNFDVHTYPYLPPHVSRPKEQRQLFLVHLPDHRDLSVPSNMKLVAVPLLELHSNPTSYGNQLSSIPQYLSRFEFTYAE